MIRTIATLSLALVACTGAAPAVAQAAPAAPVHHVHTMSEGVSTSLTLAAETLSGQNNAPDKVVEQVSPGSVWDNAQVFSNQDAEQLHDMMDRIYTEHGIVIGVETLDTLNGNDIRSYALRQHDANALGDDGMLFVVALDDQEFFTTLGDNLTHIDESILEQILRDTMPDAFREGNYVEGIEDAAVTAATADGSYSSSSDDMTAVSTFMMIFSALFFLAPIGFFLLFFFGIIWLARKGQKQLAETPAYVPSKKAKAKIVQEVSELYQKIQSENVSHVLTQAEGKDERERVLKDRGVLKSRQSYTLYMDRILVTEYYDIVPYNSSDAIDFLQVRHDAYMQDIREGTLTAEQLYSTMSVEEKVLFQQNTQRTDILTAKGYGFDTQEDIERSLDLEEELVMLLQSDPDVRQHMEGLNTSSHGSRHRSHRRGGRSRSSRSSRSSGGRGAGGSW